jgi:hypothetical protein
MTGLEEEAPANSVLAAAVRRGASDRNWIFTSNMWQAFFFALHASEIEV